MNLVTHSEKKPRISPLQKIIHFLFHDEIRSIELFSALNLLAWAYVLEKSPDLLARDSYSVFSALGHAGPAVIFLLTSMLQIFAMLNWRWVKLRFVAMALASGAWGAIATQFWWSGTLTTANLNYTFLATACAFSGVRLAWKT